MASYFIVPGCDIQVNDGTDTWHTGKVVEVTKEDGRASVTIKYTNEDNTETRELTDDDFENKSWRFEDNDLHETICSIIVSDKRLEKLQQCIDQLEQPVLQEDILLETEDENDSEEESDPKKGYDSSDDDDNLEKTRENYTIQRRSQSPLPIILIVFSAWLAAQAMKFYYDYPMMVAFSQNATKTNIMRV